MRVAYFLTHPIQYQSPMLRHLVSEGADIHVVYASDHTAKSHQNTDYRQEIKWDVPLLEGYPHTVLNEVEIQGSHHDQKKIHRQKISKWLDSRHIDAVWLHGWSHPYSQAAWSEAFKHRIPILLRGETSAHSIKGGKFRRLLHQWFYSKKFKQVAAFLAVGSLNSQLYLNYRVPKEKIFLMPYAVDNAHFQATAKIDKIERNKIRNQLGITSDHFVAFCCARLAPEKSIDTLIHAIGKVKSSVDRPILLLVAGDGPLRHSLESMAAQVVPNCVRFLGFKNQTELPALYAASDVFVLPSKFEPWGLVINEAMNAGKPIIASDQVGCGPDLIHPEKNGLIFQTSDSLDLANAILTYVNHPEKVIRDGKASEQLISTWGFKEDLIGLNKALLAVT